MNFVALDFETANSSRDSVCSIGLVEYENGNLKREYYRLVKPKRNDFSSFNIGIHGITKEDVKDADEFDELWERDIRSVIEGKLVVAHNAQFDMSVLRAVLDQYNLPYPILAYNCTVNISKKTWHLPKYNLDLVSDHLGISLNHHQALDDARASAQILLKAGEYLNATDERDLVAKTGTTNGMMYDAGYEPARLNKKKPAQRPEANTFVAATSERDSTHPFYRSSFVFTGIFEQIKRDEAVQRIVDIGGEWHSSVERSTNYVVVGQHTYEDYLIGEKSSKLERVETLLSQGFPIEMISEAEFLKRL